MLLTCAVGSSTVSIPLWGMALLGVLGLFMMPDFPATDYITALAVGIVSGLAATGINQVYKQLSKGE